MGLQAQIIALSVAYALLGALLLVILLRARVVWQLKAAAIGLTSAFYCVAFFKTQGLLGWSAMEGLPAHFQLLWARIVEPDLADGDLGAVHLWIEELDDANLPSGVPRAYRMRYSAALAAKAEAARSEIMKGHPQGGRAVDFGQGGGQAAPESTVVDVTSPRASVAAGGDPSGGGVLDPEFLRGESKQIEFAPLPGAILPPKDAP